MEKTINELMKRGWLAGIALVMCQPVSAHEEEKPIHSPNELSQWCKTLVEQHYLPQNLLPRNWRESQLLVDGDYFKAKLVFRIEYEDYLAECTVRAGAQRKYVVLQLLGKR
jgi:hypothetical protein